MSQQDRGRALADLAQRLRRTHDEEPTAQAIIDRALDLVPDAQWVSLTVRGPREHFVTLASSSAGRVREADELQYTLREGPCVDASLGGEWYRSGSVGTDARWPQWGPRAAELGIGSLLSVRLDGPERPLGALNLYSAEEHRFADRDEVDFALLYGAHVAVALAAAREIDGLHTALATRHTIGLAQGILMERFGLSVNASFDLLRRYSNDLNLKLADVATEVVSLGRLPGQDELADDRSADPV